ncbi:hypothetical protein ACWDUX_30305 [Streptomyces sp. NPDC003444]
MQINRSKHEKDFTILPNKIARHRRLSLTAKGLLTLLLAQPEWTDETIKTLTEDEEEGQARVGAAVKQLQAAGYLTVTNKQNKRGHWYKVVAVYDRPITASPKPDAPKSGEPTPRLAGPVPSGEKNREKNPPVPPSKAFAEVEDQEHPEEGQGGESDNNEKAGRAAGVLSRIAKDVPSLRLKPTEILSLAPLAAEWLARGATELQLRNELIEGLPRSVKSPAKLLANRLERKMPPLPVQVEPLGECGKCEAVLPRGQQAGICGHCAGVAASPVQAETSSGLSDDAVSLMAAIRDRRASGRFAPGAKSVFMTA